MGYLSTHVDIRSKDGDSLAIDFSPSVYSAELQVRTMAQHLWADMAHDTFYKNDETLNPLPPPLQRRVNVLAGVVEVADNEFDRLNREMPATPEVALLKSLEKHYLTLTSRRSNVELSLKVIRLLFPLYQSKPRQIAVHFRNFFAERADVLRAVYSDAETDEGRSAFLYQPETLMIYHLLETKPIATHHCWNTEFPERELERIATPFGISSQSRVRHMTSQFTQKSDSDSGKEKKEEKEEGEGNMAEKSRWWDHYYVRYFVGSVFAVPLMLTLSKDAALKPLMDARGDSKLVNATFLGAAGVAFCYVASAPILLLHAALRARRSKAESRGFPGSGFGN